MTHTPSFTRSSQFLLSIVTLPPSPVQSSEWRLFTSTCNSAEISLNLSKADVNSVVSWSGACQWDTDNQDFCFSGSKDYISCTRQTERADRAYLETWTGPIRSIKLEDTNNNVYSDLQVCGPFSHPCPCWGHTAKLGTFSESPTVSKVFFLVINRSCKILPGNITYYLFLI